MSDLENTNPIMDNPGEDLVNPNDLGTNLQNPMPEEQQAPDFSELFSENISENTHIQEELVQEEPVQEEPAQEEPTPSPETPDLQENSEELASTPEPVNQEEVLVSETNFDQVIEHTALDNNPQNVQTTQPGANELQKATIEQKKLLLLKQQEAQTKKAKKSWFTTWILSGILLTLLLLIAGVLFAKDYVLDAVDYVSALLPTNTASLWNNNVDNNNLPIENNENEDNALTGDVEEFEIIEDENSENSPSKKYYDEVDEILSAWYDRETATEKLNAVLEEIMQENEELDTELTQYIYQTIMDLTINAEETENEENNTPESDNEIDEQNKVEEDDKWYTITHVNSEEKANWVMPPHCTDLTCYGEDEEFVACTSFRMIETLDENTPRVSSRWGCKYKDVSELVYVEFNDNHNSAGSITKSIQTVEIGVTPNKVNVWEIVNFKASTNISDNDIVDYVWDFGDWNNIDSQFAAQVNHIFGEQGIYTITLTVYDKYWNNSTNTQSVSVWEADENINK